MAPVYICTCAPRYIHWCLRLSTLRLRTEVYSLASPWVESKRQHSPWRLSTSALAHRSVGSGLSMGWVNAATLVTLWKYFSSNLLSVLGLSMKACTRFGKTPSEFCTTQSPWNSEERSICPGELKHHHFSPEIRVASPWGALLWERASRF